MFVTIRQVQADNRNRFEVASEGQILFRAETPWSGLTLPFQAEHLRKLTFTDPDGRELFHTQYNLLENTAQSLSRHKSWFGKSTRLAEYQVMDRDGRLLGSFYTQVDGVLTSQLTISYGGRRYDCYHYGLGKMYVISVFEGAHQIAQITKPLDTWDQLDVYYLHLEESSREVLPILSFFIIYVDAMKFNRAGRFMKYSVEKSWSRTVNKNNRKYDPKWIENTFGPAAVAELNRCLLEKPSGRRRPPISKKGILAVVVGVGAAVLVLAVVLGLVLFTYLQPKTALSPTEFVRQMEELGYTVSESAGQAGGTGYEAANGLCSVRFVETGSEGEAQRLFHRLEDQVMDQTRGSYREISLSGVNSNRYTLVSGGTCYMMSRVEETVVVCTAPADEEGELKDVLKALGY